MGVTLPTNSGHTTLNNVWSGGLLVNIIYALGAGLFMHEGGAITDGNKFTKKLVPWL